MCAGTCSTYGTHQHYCTRCAVLGEPDARAEAAQSTGGDAWRPRRQQGIKQHITPTCDDLTKLHAAVWLAGRTPAAMPSQGPKQHSM